MINFFLNKISSRFLLICTGIYITSFSVYAQGNIWKPVTDSTQNISSKSTSGISGQLLNHTPAGNITNTLYGVLPGLIVTQGNGEPGNDAAYLSLRGNATYNNNDIVVYVDGFQSTLAYFQNLSASEIESVTVLKDAATLSQFGMKGANGVLWVMTKRGKIGKTRIEMQVRTGIQQPININKPLGSYDYANIYNQAASNDNGRIWTPKYTDSQLQSYKDGSGTNVSWYDQVLKSSTPFQDANFNINGGDSNARYFIVGSFLNNQGMYNVNNDDTHSNLQFQSYNLRSNLDMNLFKIFEAKLDIGGRIQNMKGPDYDTKTLYANLDKYPSNIYPVKNADGSWTGTSTFPDNPVGVTNDYGIREFREKYLQANLSLKEKLDFIAQGFYLTEGISFNTWTKGSNSKWKRFARYINGVVQTTDLNTNYSVWDDSGTDQYSMNQTKLGLGYDKTFGLHTISAVVNYLWFSNKVDVNQNGWAGTSMNYNYENLGGTIHYDFNKKYIADFGFAASGSDNYAKGNQWGFYPALSAAWVISNESFLINNKTIDQLKLRASAGKTGNDQFWGDRYLYQQYFGSAGSYNTGTTSITNHGGTIQINTPNPNFFAEQSLKYDVGIDLKLFKKLQVTVEAFMDNRSGIVTQDNTVMATFGGASPYNNVGKVTNQGAELSVTFNDKIGKFSYFVNGMVTYSQNVIDYMAEVQPISGMRQTGNSINSKYGNQSIGFYQVADFNADGTLKSSLPTPAFGAVQPGDLKYKDINGDGKINELDVAKIGLPYLPSTYYSFSCGIEYQGLDLQALFQGAAGRDVNLLDDYNQVIAFNNNGNAFAIAKGAWAYYPDQNIDTRSTATYPRLSLTNNQNNYRTSNFWIKNGNFLRLRNVELGYSLPKSVIKQIHFTKVRFFANTTNPFTWSSLLTNYHIDPETMTGVPALKTTTVGVTLNF